ncbi:hypothetical protein CF328_g5450 [Tilletia controversa]|nr:hypothetical protein CF328_g5450 [Tilletia controversa]
MSPTSTSPQAPGSLRSGHPRLQAAAHFGGSVKVIVVAVLPPPLTGTLSNKQPSPHHASWAPSSSTPSPPLYNYSQIQATPDAGAVACLTVMRINNALTAAPTAYGPDE